MLMLDGILECPLYLSVIFSDQLYRACSNQVGLIHGLRHKACDTSILSIHEILLSELSMDI